MNNINNFFIISRFQLTSVPYSDCTVPYSHSVITEPLLSIYLSFGQGSSLLWTHTLRPFIAGPLR